MSDGSIPLHAYKTNALLWGFVFGIELCFDFESSEEYL